MENKNRSFKYKFTSYALALASVLGTGAQAASYQEVWAATQEGKYSTLPSHPTTRASFFSNGINILAKSANRTLTDNADTLPQFQKLVHPIGICFSGTWNITKQTAYTGYFTQGSKGLIIVRASEAMGQPLQGDYRAFGLAGKLFPTQDTGDGHDYKTANFFTIDDLGGTMSNSFMDLSKSNAPATSFHLSTVFSIPMIGTILSAFKAADSNPGVRQMYQVSELGLDSPQDAVTPKGFRLTNETASRFTVLPADFRNELRLGSYPGKKLTFAINVAAESNSKYERIGTIELTEESLSNGCDHRLHFQHPHWRN